MKTKWNKIASYNPQENLKLMEIFTVVEFKKNDYLNWTTTKTTFEENCINPSNTWACAEANGMKNLCSNLKLLSKWQRTPARFIHNNKFNTEFETSRSLQETAVPDSLFEVGDPRPPTLLEKRFWDRCFPAQCFPDSCTL